MKNRQRMLNAFRGQEVDYIPFAPRLDLWHAANQRAGTLPAKYKDSSPDDIARDNGWALHKVNPNYQQHRKEQDNLHWGLGLMAFKETVADFILPSSVEFQVERQGEGTRITYHTPKGLVSTTIVYTEEMRAAGVSSFHIQEFAIKDANDYGPLAYIFENLELTPDYKDFTDWKENEVGDDGVAFAMAGRAASPMHHIQKYLIDPTQFFYHYRDHHTAMGALEESLGLYFQKLLPILVNSPAEAIYWGANFDETLTYPEYFKEKILPWIQKASAVLRPAGKFLSCHCDGENQGLLELIGQSGMDIAEAVCPHPMTKVTLAEYYRRLGSSMAIFGGIPSILLLEESASDEEFQDYLEYIFKAVAPGMGIVLGVADSTPPGAVFDRLMRLGEAAEDLGRLPLKADVFPNFPLERTAGDTKPTTKTLSPVPEKFELVRKAVLAGDDQGIVAQIEALLTAGTPAEDILQSGMLSAMEIISERFGTNQIFIPEVLLSARAMNVAALILEPHLARGRSRGAGKIVIGTVKGDLHDIGKNLVLTMMRGVGFEIVDLGMDVSAVKFVEAVTEHKPDLIGLSALLTTTMPQMKKVIEALEEAGLRNAVKVMVGGAPVNKRYADQIGADGYASNASEAVKLARGLLRG